MGNEMRWSSKKEAWYAQYDGTRAAEDYTKINGMTIYNVDYKNKSQLKKVLATINADVDWRTDKGRWILHARDNGLEAIQGHFYAEIPRQNGRSYLYGSRQRLSKF